MKALPISLEDKALLNARNMAETIMGHIKEFSSLNLSKHRSVINAFVHIIAAITAYQGSTVQAQAQPSVSLSARNHCLKTPYPGYVGILYSSDFVAKSRCHL